MRLIDADRLKDSIIFTCDLGGWIGETLLQIKKVAVKYIENAPTIDAVEVIRCKDCRHWRTSYCVIHGDSWEETDYCSDGERKDKR